MKYVKTLSEKKEKVKVAEVTMENEVNVYLCNGESLLVKEEFLINYPDLGDGQVIVLDLGAPVSLAGTKWLRQYLEEFDLTIE